MSVGRARGDAEAIIASRRALIQDLPIESKRALEGGCGVIGIIGTRALPGRHIIRPCEQMRNRGNGKGGGVAAAGLFAEHRGHYALHLAYLDESVRAGLEREFITDRFEVDHEELQPTIDDHREVGLEFRPPTVRRYFVRAKRTALDEFAAAHGIEDEAAAEDELVYQNSFALNRRYYTGDDPRAFVLSHGRDLMILKGVGFAEEIARYYCLDDWEANLWIGHQRYPTRGRVWHPGGAHPFAGLHEALVHNGDFANYHATSEYLRQWGMVPLFVTDTEVSVLLFDLYSRVLGYPLEFVIEALGPTPEGDFERLSKRRQRIYRAIQSAHLHGSPDGPWFFIVARLDPATALPQLLGITDVAMLRPQVFALQQGEEASFGAIASEKQAIDAFFEEVHLQHPDVPPVADRYWNARGGSFTDGGSFSFTIRDEGDRRSIEVRDKFGQLLDEPAVDQAAPLGGARGVLRRAFDPVTARGVEPQAPPTPSSIPPAATRDEDGEPAERVSSISLSAEQEEARRREAEAVALLMADLQRGDLAAFSKGVAATATNSGPRGWAVALSALTHLRDRRYHPGELGRAWWLAAVDQALVALLDTVPGPEDPPAGAVRLGWSQAWSVPLPEAGDADEHLVIDARDFPPEGPRAVNRVIVEAFRKGFRRFVVYGARGDRFIGCGLGQGSEGVRIDVYGSSGDYLGSGVDGAHIYVHGDAQDQVGQIFKSGRLVVFGSVGQTFLYGAKGGEAFVRGNAAGRPLINAVGRIRAIINGTCLDYCAESFMAGEVLGGGFVVINGLVSDRNGRVMGLELKYPGNNLFSLASGGACYLNDPYQTVTETQLNGASFVSFRQEDWNVLRPYLELNEELFGISIRYDLLEVDGVLKWPKEVFRKVVASVETEKLDWSALPP